METTTAARIPTEARAQADSPPKWAFDLKHSSVNFWVRHLMVSKVHGQFAQWTGDFQFDETNPGSSHVDVRIDAASIDTREAQRDAHLRSPDFFDVEKYPQITFRSSRVDPVGEAAYHVVGDLSIHGVTKSVVLNVDFAGRAKDPWGSERVGFTARTSIDRKDFGLVYNTVLEAGGVMVGDKVEIVIEVEAAKQTS
jgi:polyisoprenoid-binding protein YceI